MATTHRVSRKFRHCSFRDLIPQHTLAVRLLTQRCRICSQICSDQLKEASLRVEMARIINHLTQLMEIMGRNSRREAITTIMGLTNNHKTEIMVRTLFLCHRTLNTSITTNIPPVATNKVQDSLFPEINNLKARILEIPRTAFNPMTNS